MKLWQREMFEASEEQRELDRASRISKLDEQRAAESAAARAREEEWRLQDEQRAAAEVAKRQAEELRKQQEAAEVVARGKAEQAAKDAAMGAEQARLDEEMERQKKAKADKEAALTIKRQASDDFAYAFEEGMEKKVKAFRQRGTGGDCLIMKLDHECSEIRIEEQCKGLPDLEALADKLDDSDPKYILYLHKVSHRDGRTSYPIAFLVYMPDQIPIHLKVLYTRPVVELVDAFKVPRHIVLDDPETLTVEWLEEMLEVKK